MSHGRTLFAEFLARQAMPRPLLVPFLDTLAPRISGVSYDAMINDPGVWSGALLKSAELLGVDGVIAGFDPVIAAEALGASISRCEGQPVVTAPAEQLPDDFVASPQLAAAIETARRMALPPGRSGACIAAVVGPQTLSRQVFGTDSVEAGCKQIKPHKAAVAEALLKAQPDMLMFVEQLGPDEGVVSPGAARLYNTLRNLAAYFNVPTAIYADGYDAARVRQISRLKMDVYVLGCDLQGNAPDLASALMLATDAIGAGIGVPLENMPGASDTLETARAACREGHRLLLTSLGTVDKGIDLESARSVLKRFLN